MNIDFIDKDAIDNLPTRVRAILGVPEPFLPDDIINSPTFILKANNYINKKIFEYEDLDVSLLDIAYVYYVCYLLCSGMYARLPKQMENVNSKTVLQNIDWDSKALEMLDMCNDAILEAIEDMEDVEYGATFAVLSDSSEYPNTTI